MKLFTSFSLIRIQSSYLSAKYRAIRHPKTLIHLPIKSFSFIEQTKWKKSKSSHLHNSKPFRWRWIFQRWYRQHSSVLSPKNPTITSLSLPPWKSKLIYSKIAQHKTHWRFRQFFAWRPGGPSSWPLPPTITSLLLTASVPMMLKAQIECVIQPPHTCRHVRWYETSLA